MRLHISLDDELIDALDARVGRRQRSAFIAATIRHALEDQRRWDDIEAALGSLQKSEHDWDADPAGWVRSQRRGESPPVGPDVPGARASLPPQHVCSPPSAPAAPPPPPPAPPLLA